MFAECIKAREDRGASISDEKKQAYLLCNFVQEYFMEKYLIPVLEVEIFCTYCVVVILTS